MSIRLIRELNRRLASLEAESFLLTFLHYIYYTDGRRFVHIAVILFGA